MSLIKVAVLDFGNPLTNARDKINQSNIGRKLNNSKLGRIVEPDKIRRKRKWAEAKRLATRYHASKPENANLMSEWQKLKKNNKSFSARYHDSKSIR